MDYINLQWIYVSAIFIVISLESSEHIQLGQACLTRDHALGECVPIRQCKEAFFERHRRITPPIMCGWIEYTPFICCRKSTERYLPDLTFKGCGIRGKPGVSHNGEESLYAHRADLTPHYVVEGKDPGNDVTRWIAAVFQEGTFVAGATLVSHRYLVSAAHIFDKKMGTVSYTVKLGAHRKSDPGRVYTIKSFVLHPRYDPKKVYYDLAVIMVEGFVIFDPQVGPVCLAPPTMAVEDYLVGRNCSVQGYGATSFGGPLSDTVLEAQLTVVQNQDCDTQFRRIFLNQTSSQMPQGVLPHMLCANSSRKDPISDSCSGDSGGPLVFHHPEHNRWYLVGVVSFGYMCALPQGYPGAYTRITYFLEWLRQTTDL